MYSLLACPNGPFGKLARPSVIDRGGAQSLPRSITTKKIPRQGDIHQRRIRQSLFKNVLLIIALSAGALSAIVLKRGRLIGGQEKNER